MLRVMTLNLWGTNHWDVRRPAVIEWIAELQPDLVALQEVWLTDSVRQAERLGARVGMAAVFRPSFTKGERRFGNAVLSRLPVLSERFLQLPVGEGHREARGMVSVQVATGSGPMWFSATHLSHLPDEGWVREAQVVAIADALDDMAGDVPPVVCGDMNSTAASPEVRFLTGQAQLGDRRCELIDAYLAANPHELGATWSHRNPNVGGSHKKDRRIDFIMAGQPRADGVGRVLASTLVCDEPRQGAWPSDHFGVMADLVGE